MDTSICIEQKGIVEEVDNHRIKVRIHPEASCGDCNARGICNLFGSTDRIIEIYDRSQHLSPGDQVTISISQGMGNKAIILGYLIPFILLISVLVILTTLGVKEWLTGLVALSTLVPYFIILYLLRGRLNRKITFTLK
jgi:positive regulator of sigma E activity